MSGEEDDSARAAESEENATKETAEREEEEREEEEREGEEREKEEREDNNCGRMERFGDARGTVCVLHVLALPAPTVE